MSADDAAGKSVLDPLGEAAASHPAADEQEQRGDACICENSIDSKRQGHGAVLRKKTGRQNGLFSGRNGKLSGDADHCGYQAGQQ